MHTYVKLIHLLTPLYLSLLLYSSSYARVAFVYTEHPAVEIWEAWRDANFEEEMQTYVDLVDFWMSGKLQIRYNQMHSR